jgi:two-component system C4-dicarboxylate transport response regulator DctD
MAKWQARDWPGNMRELRSFAKRLVLGVAESAPGAVGVVGAVVNPAPVIECSKSMATSAN